MKFILFTKQLNGQTFYRSQKEHSSVDYCWQPWLSKATYFDSEEVHFLMSEFSGALEIGDTLGIQRMA